MAQTICLTITPELETALSILRRSTSGTLNTTELIKLSVGELAQIQEVQSNQMTPEIMNAFVYANVMNGQKKMAVWK